jgi:hypothetical protein
MAAKFRKIRLKTHGTAVAPHEGAPDKTRVNCPPPGGHKGKVYSTMRRAGSWTLTFGGLICAAVQCVAAGATDPVPIPERARGAARVVVATVADTEARYERNAFGDNLIVTYVQLAVEEDVKGPGGPATLAVEGGTLDGVTMRVSSLPTVAKGERAVFFLTPGSKGEFRPHLRGQGILKLDANDRVPGSSLTLDAIRRLARSGQ